jgi:hypothetical protein
MKSEQAPCIVEWVLVNAALDRIYLVQLSATKLVNKRLVPPQGWFTVPVVQQLFLTTLKASFDSYG